MKRAISMILAMGILFGMLPIPMAASASDAETESLSEVTVLQEQSLQAADETADSVQFEANLTVDPVFANNIIASGTCGENLTWTLRDDGVLTVSGEGDMLSAPWADYADQIVAVTLEDGITSIADSAFYDCRSITTISIPDSVTSIGDSAFSYCGRLTTIPIPDSVTSIEAYTFNHCESLTTISIPDSVTSIGEYAFSYCKSLTTISIPDGVTSIEAYTFNHCESLTTISIPDSVTSIGEYAFYYCESLTTISIPDSVNSIGEGVFGYCSSLTTVTIPEGVTSIGSDTFSYCEKLTMISIPDSVTSIGEYAFFYCSSLTTVTIPEGVTSIGSDTFSHCEKLTTISIPDSVTSIEEFAFYCCESLTTISIPDSVTSIGERAFGSCSSLTTISIPDSVTSIEADTFYNCESLTTILIPDSVTSIGEYAFAYCESLTSISIPDRVTSIEAYTFCGCESLTTISIPDSVTSIGEYAFYYCESLTTISIPDSVTSIGEYAFSHCKSLTTISIPYSVTSIGEYAFAYCESLTMISIPDSVTSIEAYTFYNCESLTTISIPYSVTSIGEYAFYWCTGMSKIYFEGKAPEFGENSFGNVTATAYYPENNSTWTPEVMQDYGGDLTWVPYNVAEEHEHHYREVVTKPTCTQKGYTTYTCSCGDSYTGNEVPALDHTVVIDPAVAPSCTKTGLTEGKHCDLCKEVLVKQEEVAALGHKWDSGVVTKEPTASAPGVRKFTCTVCKATKTEEIVYCNVYRVSGKDRVKTALSVANALLTYRQIEKFDAVIIATGVNEKFADALSGSYLANMKKAPILLYTNSGLSQLNVKFIKERLKAGGTVYILGGTSAIPESVEKTLSDYKVKRLSGKSRYETNLEILKEAGVSGAKEILVATGTNFADSLSASAVGLPLMLVNGKGTGLNGAQINFLKSVAGKKITIIGGTGAVNEEMEVAIEAAAGVNAERISGKTRHDTSVLIAQKYFNNPGYALITYAKNFPDGLAGGPLAYAMGAPLLLTSAGQESITNTYLTSEGIDKGFVLGGDSAVSDETARKAFGLANGAVIEKAFYTE